MVRRAGPLVRKNPPRRSARPRPRRRPNRTPEARLPLPLHSEIAQPPEAEYAATGNAGADGKRKHSANKCDCGCGCVVADVERTGQPNLISASPAPTTVADVQDVNCLLCNREKDAVHIRLVTIKKLPCLEWEYFAFGCQSAPLREFSQRFNRVLQGLNPSYASVPSVVRQKPVKNQVRIMLGLRSDFNAECHASGAGLQGTRLPVECGQFLGLHSRREYHLRLQQSPGVPSQDRLPALHPTQPRDPSRAAWRTPPTVPCAPALGASFPCGP